MKHFGLLFLLLLFFIPSKIIAQKEASIWSLGNGEQLNFQSGNFEFSSFTHNNKVNATICDKEGNLVLYTDGYTVWNASNEVLINGDQIMESNHNITPGSSPVFIPYPDKQGFYILIYETVPSPGYNINQKKVVCAEINVNAFGGRGEVISSNIKIHDDYHSNVTIAGYCDNSYFWLLLDRNDNIVQDIRRDRIYFYKIDKNGVNLAPKIDDYLDIGNSHGYKFSPNGDKFFFSYYENRQREFWNVIADFNFITGEMYNIRSVGYEMYTKEFSPDSRLLYFFSGANLIQLDVGYSNSIQNSADTILTLLSDTNIVYPGGDIQLALDGKIYFYYREINDNLQKIGRINKPNKKGDACDVELEIATINSNYHLFPDFITSFFRDKEPENLDEVFANAGPTLEICSKSSDTLGVNQHSGALYKWYPNTYIENPFSAQAIFKAPLQMVYPRSIPLTLRVTDGNCWVNFDKTTVTVLPRSDISDIDGSWSVCPFVEEVDYWTDANEYDIKWLVNGGEIVSNQANDSIKINWGETSSSSSISAFVINEYGCASDTSVFPVRINVELITETPKGPDKLCLAKGKDVTYQIGNTNGSVYNWIIDNGKILTGQGTNKISVSWRKAGIHNVFVEEISHTIDTICYGESKPLIVEIINDSLEIHLNQVSFISTNDINLNFQSEKLDLSKHYLQLEIENEFGEFIKAITIEGTNYRYKLGEKIYSEILRLKVTNLCNEIFYSNPQQTIVLNAIDINSENTIQLSWNINRFWENDRLTHEIWYSDKGEEVWQLVAQLSADTNYDFVFQGNSLFHLFRVKEINNDKNIESWSNTVEIEVDDKIKIPDVFTPNGDGYNDTWEVENINFHSIESVEVFNRFGHKVYECKNEFIPWDGKINGKILQGTYFYQITFDAENIKHGQITILQ